MHTPCEIEPRTKEGFLSEAVVSYIALSQLFTSRPDSPERSSCPRVQLQPYHQSWSFHKGSFQQLLSQTPQNVRREGATS